MGGHRLRIDPRSVAIARDLLRGLLREHSAATGGTPDAARATDRATLAVSELVSNAVRHAHRLLLLEAEIRDGTLHVDVVDDAAAPPRMRDVDKDAVGGRGLRIVEQVTDRWGVVAGQGRKTVWFEVELLSGR